MKKRLFGILSILCVICMASCSPSVSQSPDGNSESFGTENSELEKEETSSEEEKSGNLDENELPFVPKK